MDKKQLRDFFKKKRQNIELRKDKNCVIMKSLLEVLSHMQVDSVMTYVSYPEEVDTFNLIQHTDYEIYVPLVDGGAMQSVRLIKKDKLVTDKLGNIGRECVDATCNKTCDVTIVPLLCFDSSLNRLGYGKGYYDKYFAANSTYKIGLAYDEQFCADIAIDAHDIPLDLVITPSRLYYKEHISRELAHEEDIAT